MTGDLHERFLDWLFAGAKGDPPRDVALHASVCPDCSQWIAAYDALAGIDPGRAPLPPSHPIAEPYSTAWSAVRVAAAASSVAVVAAAGLFAFGPLRGGGVFGAGTGATQGVLGVTGVPQASPRPPTQIGGQVEGTPHPNPTNVATRGATSRPAVRASRAPRLSLAPSVAASQAATPVVTPTPTSAATPTLLVTPTPTPTPLVTPTPTPAPSSSA